MRVASAVAATRPTFEAAVDAIFAASYTSRYAMVSPTRDTDRERRDPALNQDPDRARRASNAVFGVGACIDIPT